MLVIKVRYFNYIRKVNKRDYSVYYKDSDLMLYKTYTRKDVCRLLNWPVNMKNEYYEIFHDNSN